MLNEKQKCRVSTGVGYCPIPALCCDIAVVSRQEESQHARQALLCARLKICALPHEGLPGKAYRDRPPWVLYQDREFPIVTEMASLVLRHRF